MDTEDRLDALEATARKNSILIGMIIVLVLWISFDLKLHTVALKFIGLEINEMGGLKSIKKAGAKKSGFDAYQINPAVKEYKDGLVKDYNGDIMSDKTMWI